MDKTIVDMELCKSFDCRNILYNVIALNINTIKSKLSNILWFTRTHTNVLHSMWM